MNPQDRDVLGTSAEKIRPQRRVNLPPLILNKSHSTSSKTSTAGASRTFLLRGTESANARSRSNLACRSDHLIAIWPRCANSAQVSLEEAVGLALQYNPDFSAAARELTIANSEIIRVNYFSQFNPVFNNAYNYRERYGRSNSNDWRGSFRSVKELVQKIDAYVANYNLHRRPFVWTATNDSILAKLKRLCKVINGTPH